MSQDRMARVNRLIQEALAQLIPKEIKDPRIQDIPLISVMEVKTTPDLRFAKVYLSIPGSEAVQKLACKIIDGASGFLRGKMGHVVRLRYTPQLQFVLDDRLDAAAKIDQILRELSEKNEDDSQT